MAQPEVNRAPSLDIAEHYVVQPPPPNNSIQLTIRASVDSRVENQSVLARPLTPSWRRIYNDHIAKKHRSSKGRQGPLDEGVLIYAHPQSNRLVSRVKDIVTERTYVLKKVVHRCAAGTTATECLKEGQDALHEVECMLGWFILK